MAPINPPIFLSTAGVEHPADGVREAMGSHWESAGVLESGHLEVTWNSGLAVTVATGQAWLDGPSAGSRPEKYFIEMDLPTGVTLDSNTSGNPRIDSLYAVVYDDDVDGSGLTEWDLFVIKGTPAASPSAPATTPGASSPPATAWLKLADIRVDHNDTSVQNQITDRRVVARLRNQAFLNIASSSQRPTTPTHGDHAYEQNTHQEVYYTDLGGWGVVPGQLLAYAEVTAANAAADSDPARDLTGLSISFTWPYLPSPRRVMLELFIPQTDVNVVAAGDPVDFYVTDSANTIWAGAVMNVNNPGGNDNSGVIAKAYRTTVGVAAGASITLKARVKCSDGDQQAGFFASSVRPAYLMAMVV